MKINLKEKDEYITVQYYGRRMIKCPICKEKYSEIIIRDHYDDHVSREYLRILRDSPEKLLETLKNVSDLKLLEEKNE